MSTNNENMQEISTDLDWMSREILLSLDEKGGPADVSEIRIHLGVENVQSINYRIKEKLVPKEYIDVMRPKPKNCKPQPKVLTLTSRGKEIAELLRGDDESNDPDAQLPLDGRLERIESFQEAPLGMWGMDKQKEYEAQLEATRLVRDFLLKKHGDEFRKYVEKNSQLNDE